MSESPGALTLCIFRNFNPGARFDGKGSNEGSEEIIITQPHALILSANLRSSQEASAEIQQRMIQSFSSRSVASHVLTASFCSQLYQLLAWVLHLT